MILTHKQIAAALTTALVCLLSAAHAAPASRPVGTNENVIQNQKQQQPQQPQQRYVKVQTSSGLLVGLETPLLAAGYEPLSANQSSIIRFLAVPYAQAPIGQLRFKKPLELREEQARATLDATHYGKTCPQFRHLARFVSPLLNLDHEHQISEDCLQLNVFVPAFVRDAEQREPQDDNGRLEPNKQLPVIVWIPGEGFDYADARQFDGSHLALRTQSIVVTVQYRVGVLGFLDSRQLGAPGNVAIHDQLMALRWVRRNINSFGGDHERVTLMGRFSGSMAISAMLTAPNQELIKAPSGSSSEGSSNSTLFKRAILSSGIAVDDWIIEDHQEEKLAGVLELARERNYCTKTQVLDGSCLQTMPIERLLEVSGFGWKLVRDHQLIGRVGPIEAIRRKSLPSDVEAILLGETESEGTLCLYRHTLMRDYNNYAELIEKDQLTSEDLHEMIRDDSLTYFKYNVSQSNPIQMALEALTTTTITTAHANSNQDDSSSSSRQSLREKYLDACSSYMVKSHNLRFKRSIEANNRQGERASLTKKPVEVYHYGLKYKPSFSLAPDYIKTAAHGDDIPLIFGLVYNQPRASVDPSDLLMTAKMMAYIGNFVHGNQPLLQQHNQIETTSTPPVESSSASDVATIGGVGELAPRSWTRGEQMHLMDLVGELGSENLSGGSRRRVGGQQQLVAVETSQRMVQLASDKQADQAAINLRLIIVDHFARAEQSQLQLQQLQQGDFGPQSALMVLLSSSIVILALMSLCVVVCICAKQTAGFSSQHFASSAHSASSSACNICDDTEAVLRQASKKNERAFCNVFSKLKGHQRPRQRLASSSSTAAVVAAPVAIPATASAAGAAAAAAATAAGEQQHC